MEAQLEIFAFSRSDFRVRKIDIGDGSTPVAAQFGIRSIPFLVLYRGTDEVARGGSEVTDFINGI